MYTIVIPVYNEERAIAPVLEKVKEQAKKINAKIVVVNDGSRDQTAQILESIKGVTVITNPYNLGYGASLMRGIKHAQTEWIIITDADGTYPITAIPELTKHTKMYEMIVGARNRKNVPLLRKPAKWILRSLAQFLTGHRIPDLNSGLRAFKKDIVLEYEHLFPKRFSFTTTITLVCLLHGYPTKFIRIPYFKRKGTSTIRPIRDFLGFLQLIFRIIIYFNPLKFFLIPGCISIALGTLIGFLQLYHSVVVMQGQAQIGDVPVLGIIMGIQLIFFGILADLIVKSRKK